MENSFEKNKNLFILTAFFVVFVGLFCGLGMYDYPSADDYSYFNAYIEKGFWGTQIEGWKTWTSRFTTFFIVHLGNAMNIIEHDQIVATILICLSSLSIFFLISALFPTLKKLQKFFIIFLLQSVWLITSPSLDETLYWFDGCNYYYTSAILLVEFALVVLMLRGVKTVANFVICAILVFLNSGVSELSAVYQVVVMFVVWLSCRIYNKKDIEKYIFLLLLVAIIGIAVQLMNGGNLARMSQREMDMSLLPRILSAIKFGLIGGLYAMLEFFIKPSVYVLLLFYPIIFHKIKPIFKLNLKTIFFAQAAAAFLFQAIGGWTIDGGLPQRGLAMIVWAMMFQWIFLFVFCYRNERFAKAIEQLRIYKYRTIAIVFCLVLNINFFSLINDYAIGAEYSKQMQERYARIEQQKTLGNFDVAVAIPTVDPKLVAFKDIVGNPEHWPNQPYAKYYGLNSIRAVSPFLLSISSNGEITPEVIEKIKQLAENGNSEAQFVLGRMSDRRHNKISPEALERENINGFKWYSAAAEQGHKEGQYALAWFHSRGWGTPDNKPGYLAAAKWYLKSLF